MLKKSLLSLAIAAGLGLAGCSGTDSTGSVDSNGGNPDQRGADQGSLDLINNPGTYPLYDPAASVLPIPSDLQYSGTTDGTIVFSGETDNSFQFIDPTTGTTGANFNPVTNALADMDGASVSGQIDLPFSGEIDETTVIANRTVFLVPLVPCQDTDGNDRDPITGCLANGELTYINPSALDGTDPTTISESFGDAVSFRADVIDRDGQTTLRISPLEALDGATRYIVFLTNGIKTTSGDSVNPSVQYNAISGDEVIPVALDPVRSLVHGYEQLAAGYVSTVLSNDLGDLSLSNENIGLLTDLGVDPTSIVDLATGTAAVQQAAAATPDAVVMSYSFTTGGTNQVLSAMAAPGVANSLLQQNHALDTLDDATLEAVITAANPDDTAEEIAVKVAGAKALRNLPAPKAREVTMKTGAQDLGFGAVVHAGTVSVPYYLTAPSFYQDLSAAADETEQLTAANVINGKWQADDTLATDLNNAALTAPSSKVTRFFPFAKETGTLDAPITVYLPADPTAINGTVIYQHGITTNRSVAAPIATQLIAAGYAVVAMDLAVHGLEPDLFVDANGLIDFTSTGAKLSPLNSAVVDATAVAAVVAGSGGALTSAQVNAAVAAVNADPTAIDDGEIATIYSSYSTAVLGQYLLSENHFGLTTDDGSTPRAINAEDISLDSGQDDAEGNDIYVTPTGEEADNARESGSLFVYLLHQQMTRDNLRQSVMNLLNLGASLSNISIDIDGDGDTSTGTQVTLPTAAGQVHFVGHSLGSIVGTSYVAINNNVGYYNVNNNAIVGGLLDQLQGLTAGTGSGLMNAVLTDSSGDITCGNITSELASVLTFAAQQADPNAAAVTAAQVEATLAGAGIPLATANAIGCGNNALPHIQTATLANGGGQLTKLLENSGAFAPTLLVGLDANGVSQTTPNFEAFMNVFQATIDSVDPLALSSSYSSPLLTATTGVLHLEVSGDAVVPNGADDNADLPYVYKVAPLDSSAVTGVQGFAAPLAGTEPLMSQLGLTSVNATVATGTSPQQLAVRFTAGDHSSFGMASFLTASPELVDVEMATQTVNFIGQSGLGLAVGTAVGGAGATVIETQTTP